MGMTSGNITDAYVQIERGGSFSISLAQNALEMRQQLLIAIGTSTLLGGDLVHIEGWLPGLTLKVQALRSLDECEQVSIDHVWQRMYALLAAWIDLPADADQLDLSFDGAHCVLIPNVFTWHILPVAFTISVI